MMKKAAFAVGILVVFAAPAVTQNIEMIRGVVISVSIGDTTFTLTEYKKGKTTEYMIVVDGKTVFQNARGFDEIKAGDVVLVEALQTGKERRALMIKKFPSKG